MLDARDLTALKYGLLDTSLHERMQSGEFRMTIRTDTHKKWWQGAVVYHIYPRSFYDADANGIGDVRGVIEKLDYLASKPDSLGVNAIWLSPFYPSPMADFGYDVIDYCDVDPIFGTLKDFDRLIKEAHARDIRVLVDFVPNHTSDHHPWFRQSSSSKKNEKRDWYTWKDPRSDGGPPNNWRSVFGGSAWQYHEPTKQYYLHSFLKEQPDLNWDNDEVRTAMKKAMCFWLDKGVDGFRVDAVSWLSKDFEFRNDPLNPNYRDGIDDPYHKVVHSFSCNGPRLYDYLNELITTTAEYKDKFMITEAYPDVGGEISHYLKYYENLDPNRCAPFNFECISFPWDAPTYRGFIDLFQQALLPGQPPIYNMGNHDKSRLASRIGREAARTAAMLLLTLPGIPFIYYGDELGMTDVPVAREDVRDPFASASGIGRDPERTPMQWSVEQYGGFSDVEPWLPVASDYPEVNVSNQKKDPFSLFNLYRQLLLLRNHMPVLKHGTYRSIELDQDVFCFVREHDVDRVTVVLNFSDKTVNLDSKALKGTLLLSTYMDIHDEPTVDTEIELRPHEGLIIFV